MLCPRLIGVDATRFRFLHDKLNDLLCLNALLLQSSSAFISEDICLSLLLLVGLLQQMVSDDEKSFVPGGLAMVRTTSYYPAAAFEILQKSIACS